MEVSAAYYTAKVMCGSAENGFPGQNEYITVTPAAITSEHSGNIHLYDLRIHPQSLSHTVLHQKKRYLIGDHAIMHKYAFDGAILTSQTLLNMYLRYQPPS